MVRVYVKIRVKVRKKGKKNGQDKIWYESKSGIMRLIGLRRGER